ncbi:hypothetical protein GGH96_001903 [Coemansia sp. RSA 1972]|nr:hypothetical protein GGH96_001903 [Coemansia sp. RSA 1972]
MVHHSHIFAGAPTLDQYPSEWEPFTNDERIQFMATFPGLRNFPYTSRPLTDPSLRLTADHLARDNDAREVADRFLDTLRVDHTWLAQVQPDENGCVPYEYVLRLMEARTRVLYDAMAFSTSQRELRAKRRSRAERMKAAQAPLVDLPAMIAEAEKQRDIQRQWDALNSNGKGRGKGRGRK